MLLLLDAELLGLVVALVVLSTTSVTVALDDKLANVRAIAAPERPFA